MHLAAQPCKTCITITPILNYKERGFKRGARYVKFWAVSASKLITLLEFQYFSREKKAFLRKKLKLQ